MEQTKRKQTEATAAADFCSKNVGKNSFDLGWLAGGTQTSGTLSFMTVLRECSIRCFVVLVGGFKTLPAVEVPAKEEKEERL